VVELGSVRGLPVDRDRQVGTTDLEHALNFVREFATMGYCFFYTIFRSIFHQVSVKSTTVATIPKNPWYSTLQ